MSTGDEGKLFMENKLFVMNNAAERRIIDKRRTPFWKRISQRRTSTKSTARTDSSVESLGIKQLLHLCQDDQCQRRAVEGLEPTNQSSTTNKSTSNDNSVSSGYFFQGKKRSQKTKGASEKTPITPENIGFKIDYLDPKENNRDTKGSLSTLVTEPTTSTEKPTNGSIAAANARHQSMSQADRQNNQQLSTSTRHQPSQQQHFQPYSTMSFFPNLSTTDPRRLYHPVTTTAAAAGFFGLIPPAPSLLPTVAAASAEAGWNRRRGNAATAGSRTYTSLDYALGVARIDSAASSSNYLLGSSGQDHFVVEFCEDLLRKNNESNNNAVAENEHVQAASETKLKTPKRKSSAPTPRSTPTASKSGAGDTISDSVVHQYKSSHGSPTPPSSPPPVLNASSAEDESPKRAQQQERLDVVLAIRGISLRDAVQGILERRKLNGERVNLFLESSNTPLPWETDTSFLGGHKLFAKAKKDDFRFSKNPLFVSYTASGQPSIVPVGGNSYQSSGNVTSPSQRQQQKQGDDTPAPATASPPDQATPISSHLFPMSPASNVGTSNNRKELTTMTTASNPGLSRSDRKLSLTQLTKKKAPDRLSLTPDSSFALSLSTASPFNAGDGMLTEKLYTPSVATPGDGSFLNGSSNADVASSSCSTPQHYHNGILPDAASTGSGSSMIGRKERSRSQGRLSQIFPNPFKQDDRLEMLERLAHFQEHGLMTAAGLLQDVNIILCQNALNLEEKWQDLTKNHESLTRKQQEQQEGLWELVTTELNYIKKLGCIVELQACVGALQTEGFLHDVDVDSLFGNITDICRANLRFWLQCVYPLLQYSRQTGEPLDPTKLEAGFQHVDRLFYPYIPYCLNHVETLCYIRRKQKESELFREFILWVQSRRVFGRLHLTDLLAKPMQRLTKYPLLLKAVLKSTNEEPGREALMNAIEKTEEFASRVNIELRHKQHYDALCNIMQCIESYDAIETSNDELDRLVKEYSYVDLTASMLGCRPKLLRQLLLRGDLKLREGYSKMDVVCFLFTDMFLVCKPIGKKGDRVRVKVARPPYHLDRVVVRQLRETAGFAFVCLNEFNLPAAACTFLTPNQDEACKWLEHFHIAKEEYQRMKLSDEVTVYKQVGRRSFDVSSLVCSNSANGSQRGTSGMDGSAVRRASGHLTAPGVSGGKDCPQRRISMTAMDEKKRRKQSPAIDAINHRKSNSMDNSVVTSAIVAAYKLSPLHGSVDGLRDSHLPRGALATMCQGGKLKSASEDDPVLTPGSAQVHETDGSSEQDGMIRRLRANSVEVLKRLSPRLRTPSSGDRSPSPCGRPSPRAASPSIFSFRSATATISEGASTANTLTPFPSAASTLTPGFSTPPTTPVPKIVDDAGRRLSGSHSPLLHQRSSSPFRKPKIPSPVFFKSEKHPPGHGPRTNADGFDSGSRCCSPSPSTVFQESASNSIEEHDEAPVASSSIAAENQPQPQPQPQPNGNHPGNSRRLERRYHTADGIEQLKPRRVPQAGILKRFSWSTPAAAAAAAASGTSSIAPKLCVNLRKASPTTISSESFGSSSGVSSSSSQLYVSQSENELTLSETPATECGTKPSSSLSSRRLLKLSAAPRVSRQQVAESPDETEEAIVTTILNRPPPSISTIVIGEATGPGEFDESECTATDYNSSNLPTQSSPATDNLRHKVIPIIETQAPTPLATPVSTHPHGHTFSGAAVPPSRPPGISKEEFLKLLLQGNLESSDV